MSGGKPNISNKFYLIKIPVTTAMIIKIRKSEIFGLITQNTENTISASFVNRIKKYLDNECIRDGEKTIRYIIIESNMDF